MQNTCPRSAHGQFRYHSEPERAEPPRVLSRHHQHLLFAFLGLFFSMAVHVTAHMISPHERLLMEEAHTWVQDRDRVPNYQDALHQYVSATERTDEAKVWFWRFRAHRHRVYELQSVADELKVVIDTAKNKYAEKTKLADAYKKITYCETTQERCDFIEFMENPTSSSCRHAALCNEMKSEPGVAHFAFSVGFSVLVAVGVSPEVIFFCLFCILLCSLFIGSMVIYSKVFIASIIAIGLVVEKKDFRWFIVLVLSVGTLNVAFAYFFWRPIHY